MLSNFLKQMTSIDTETSDKLDQIFQDLYRQYPNQQDAWGLDLKHVRKSVELVYPIYKKYFRTRTFGLENVQNHNYVVCANHSGQIALDGAIICSSFILDSKPPRVLRPMVERFFPSIPFVGAWSANNGSVLGDRQNCINLLNQNKSVLVFPEGVKGVAKNTNEFYNLKSFSRGFLRIAAATKTPILPIAVVGAEEMYPLVYHFNPLAKLLGLPALPLSPSYILGPLGFLPLPSPIDLYIGPEITVHNKIDDHTSDQEVDIIKLEIESKIQELINIGLKKRRKFWAQKIVEKFKK